MDLFNISDNKTYIMRDYQIRAVDASIQYLKSSSGNPIVCAATGTGKSIIIASLIDRVCKANNARIMVATHVAELVEQNAAKLKSIAPHLDIGIYSAGLGLREHKNKVVFAGIQSIYRVKDLGVFNVLIVDEAHTISKKDKSMWASLIGTLKEANPRLRILGLSATPFRLDSGSLIGEDTLFDDIIFDYGLGLAVQDGWLCPLTTKGTSTKYNIEGVGKVAGEYNLKELEEATNVDELTRQAVAEMIERGADRKSWLIFCNGVAHSFSIRDEIRRNNITCETVTGETPDYERDRILKEFNAGSIRAVTNNAVWTTGVDVPGVDMIGMLRHTMSGGLLLQMAGRGTRSTIDLSPYKTAKERREAIAASNKPNCLFLDFAGNIQRHGFLDTIGPKDKKKGDGVAPMKLCDECFTICHAAAKSCKDCGYVFPENEKEIVQGLYGGDVLSNNAPELRPVQSVSYLPHNVMKEGRIPCLRVKYIHDDGTATSEYVCLWHEGFAKQKAEKWWDERDALSQDITGLDVVQLVQDGYCNFLKTPDSIIVKKDGKYDRIIQHNNLELRKKSYNTESASGQDFNTIDEHFEIPW